MFFQHMLSFIKLPPIFHQIVPKLLPCVPLFFVVSAFSLAYSYDEAAHQPGWVSAYVTSSAE